MRITSGVTDQVINFVAVDATDLKTRETGLTTFTVYRCRNGGTPTAMTTPTVTEADATNMPGVYELLLDEDMTIGSGNLTEEIIYHITQAAMAPVSRSIELFAPENYIIGTTTTNTDMRGTNDAALATALATAQTDLDTITGGDGAIIASAQTVATVTDVTNTVDSNLLTVNAAVTPITNFEDMYDGTGYTDSTAPSSRSQLDSISTGSAAISTNADSVENVIGDETGTVDNTRALDGTVYSIAKNGTIAVDFIFSVGSVGIPTEVLWNGYAQSQGSTYTVQMYNYNNSTWDGVGSISGASGTTVYEKPFKATVSYVGTGVNIGEVKLRITSSDGSLLAIDRILVSYSVVNQSVGYSLGSIWVDDSATNENTVDFTDGTADNPVSTWAAALTLSASLGIKSFNIANGTSITLTDAITEFNMFGSRWSLALASQAVGGAYIEGATVTGIGVEGATHPKFKECRFGAVTLPPSGMQTCGFGYSSGQFTAGGDGQYIIVDGFSLVPGSGSPAFVFTGLLLETGINNRGWRGGATYTLDSDCILSHEVLAGGGTTITTGGGDAEIRGITRSLTLVLSAAETVQFVGTTGLINVSGTTTATVNLYGVSSSVTDTSSAATINDETVNTTNIDTIIADISTVDGKLPAALVSGRMSSDIEAISGSTTAATNLSASAEAIYPNLAQTGTLSTTEMTTDMTITTEGQFNGAIIVFRRDTTTAALRGQRTDITGTAVSGSKLTFTALTNAPINGDSFVVI